MDLSSDRILNEGMKLSRLEYGTDLDFSSRQRQRFFVTHHFQTFSIIQLSPPTLVSGAVSKRVEGTAATRQPPMSYCKGERCEASYVPLWCNKQLQSTARKNFIVNTCLSEVISMKTISVNVK